MKITLVATLFLALSGSQSLAASRQLKICFTGATERIVQAYGDAILNGGKLALKTFAPKNGIQVELDRTTYEPTPLAPLRTLKELYQKGCAAVIGFNTMNDLLAVREYAQEHKLLVISIYGERDSSFDKYPETVTLQPSAKFLVDRFSSLLLSKARISHIAR